MYDIIHEHIMDMTIILDEPAMAIAEVSMVHRKPGLVLMKKYWPKFNKSCPPSNPGLSSYQAHVITTRIRGALVATKFNMTREQNSQSCDIINRQPNLMSMTHLKDLTMNNAKERYSESCMM